ncbi:hypothetical protein FACS1894211_09100 [Clostridia bacterium]|nr:hypothetical protein FACS1894211_09100 [Clostridia bacterium]
MYQAQQTQSPEDLLLAYMFGAAALQERQPDNTCKMEFVTDGGDTLSRKLYEDATVITAMGKYTPTRKFLNEVADTIAADMVNYLKDGGAVKNISAEKVYF